MRDPAPDQGPDPVPDGDDGPTGAAQREAVARLVAEPRLLAAWSRDARDPRLADAYRALGERVPGRIEALADGLLAADPDPETLGERLAHRVAALHEETLAVDAELARLKWLLQGRRMRMTTDALPAYEAHEADEEHESETLERLIQDLTLRIC